MIITMSTTRRLLLGLVGVLVLSIVWSVWTAWRTERDLRAAEEALDRLQSAVGRGDDGARDAAVTEFRDSAASAKDRTDGLWWSAMTKLPLLGDDAAGVEVLSTSVDLVAQDAVGPLVATIDSLDGLVADGRVDPSRVTALQEPVVGASQAVRDAADLMAAPDSRNFVSALRTRYDNYARRISGVAEDFSAAETALEVLPTLLGADGPRDYLFVFQNNAEIRSTGGLPGSWARVHVNDGTFELLEQGNASDLATGKTEADLTGEELAVYDDLPALYFQDANFIPDFPRAADIFDKFWSAKYPSIKLDGVLALDPVGMSYLITGTGPVTAGPLTLTAENIVAELLNNTYLTVADPVAQDRRFQQVARAIFTSTSSELASPLDFVTGISRAIHERRLLFAPFESRSKDLLSDTTILGAISGDDGSTPHVDIGVNDTTGSKMSYYLRYDVDVRSQSCRDEVQRLTATMTLNQAISPADAKNLPDVITGGGAFGTPIGSQLVALRIYGPFEGTIENVLIDGKRVDPEYGLSIDGRPVVTVVPLIETRDDVLVTWEMMTGPSQTGAGELGVTPSVVSGSSDSRFASAC